MYQKFTVSSLKVQEASNTIVVGFTFDVDEDTVSDRSIYVTEAKAGVQPLMQVEKTVDGSTITLHYVHLKVNTPYEIHVTKDIHSILDNPLAIEFLKEFQLKSEVDSTISIISPVDHEEQPQLKLHFKETPGANKMVFKSYRVQAATDVNFLDLVLDDKVKVDKLDFAPFKENRQYFVRVRAEMDGNYGNWSEPVTFSQNTLDLTEAIPDSDADDVLVERPLEVIAKPETGESPSSFIIEFNGDIDPASIDISSIMVTRKDV